MLSNLFWGCAELALLAFLLWSFANLLIRFLVPYGLAALLYVLYEVFDIRLPWIEKKWEQYMEL